MGATISTASGTVTADDFAPMQLTHRIVIGPKFLYAFFNPNDELHEHSRALAEFVRRGELPYRQFVVNGHALDEAATRLKKRAGIRYAELLFEAVSDSQLFRLHHVSAEVFEQTSQRFRSWDDNDASFTDFVIATQMEALEIDHIATYDGHYELFDVVTIPHANLGG